MYNVLHENAGPSSYAKKKKLALKMQVVLDAFFVAEKMLKHIQHCTEIEVVRRTRNNNWKVSLDELDAFTVLLYIRGNLHAKGFSIDASLSTKWGSRYFNETTPRNRFKEITRYLLFNVKSTRSQRLLHDRFTLLSKV